VSDPYDLERFVAAQHGMFETALAEIRGGAKRSHWMWFIFPQLAGLGNSAMAQHYAIGSLAEARAYLDHGILGPRLRRCVEALGQIEAKSAEQLFGPIDALKLRSSLTLFAEASDEPLFSAALKRWFGQSDPRTIELLHMNR